MSLRPALLGLGLLASALAASIVLELDAARPLEDETGIVAIRHLPRAQPRVASEDPEDHTDQWAAVALARPLFSRDRKPTPLDAKGGGGPVLAALPRLTGVVIGPFGRTAIFAGADGARPTAVAEGQTLGAYTVRAIAPGRVTVTGPQGERVVSLSGDAATRNTLAAEMPQPPPPPTLPPPPVPGLLPGQQPGVLVPNGAAPDASLSPQLRASLHNLRLGPQFQPGPRNAPPQEGSD